MHFNGSFPYKPSIWEVPRFVETPIASSCSDLPFSARLVKRYQSWTTPMIAPRYLHLVGILLVRIGCDGAHMKDAQHLVSRDSTRRWWIWEVLRVWTCPSKKNTRKDTQSALLTIPTSASSSSCWAGSELPQGFSMSNWSSSSCFPVIWRFP